MGIHKVFGYTQAYEGNMGTGSYQPSCVNIPPPPASLFTVLGFAQYEFGFCILIL